MIPVHVNNRLINFPTRWEDVTTEQYLKLTALSFPGEIEAVAFFLGYDVSLVSSQLSTEHLYKLVNLLGFFFEPMPYTNDAIKLMNSWSVKKQTYAAYVDACGIIDRVKKGESLMPHIAEIAACFHVEQPYDTDKLDQQVPLMRNSPISYVLPVASFMIDQITKESDWLGKNIKKAVYTPEQIAAGIKTLESLGVLNVLDSLANGDKTKYKDLLLMSVGEIHTFVIAENRRYNYEKKYNDIQEAKQKQRK